MNLTEADVALLLRAQMRLLATMYKTRTPHEVAARLEDAANLILDISERISAAIAAKQTIGFAQQIDRS